MHTCGSLKKDLAAMGLRPYDTVMMHSSMKSIGTVEGGADAVLNALCDYFAEGVIALPELSWTLAYEKDPVFDVKNTPSVVGILPQLFRQRENVYRSWHPTHSVAAYGKDAQAFVSEDHLNSTPCGPRSSWHKLLERGGKILNVGCTLTTCTFIHGIEEWADIDGRLDPAVEYTILPPQGEPFRMKSQPHHGTPSEQFYLVEDLLVKNGALTFGKLGDAKVYVTDAVKAYELITEQLKKTPRIFDDV